VPVFFKKACVFFQNPCVFEQIAALEKLYIYALPSFATPPACTFRCRNLVQVVVQANCLIVSGWCKRCKQVHLMYSGFLYNLNSAAL